MMTVNRFSPRATKVNIKLALIKLAEQIAQRKAQFSQEQLDQMRRLYHFAYNQNCESTFRELVNYINCQHVKGFKLEVVKGFNHNGASIEARKVK